MDLAKRKKLIGLKKRDRPNIAAKKPSNNKMLALVQEKLLHLEANYNNINEKESDEVTPPSRVLPNIAEYTSTPSVKYIRHPVRWSIEDIERGENHQGNGDVDRAELHRLTSDDGLPIEMFGNVKSIVCSVM